MPPDKYRLHDEEVVPNKEYEDTMSGKASEVSESTMDYSENRFGDSGMKEPQDEKSEKVDMDFGPLDQA